MVNKVTTEFSATDKGFTASLKNIKTSVSEADGVMGKLKAGASGVGGVLKENMAAGAVAAGTALVAFGVKAAHAFEDTAKAAIDLGSATGLSTEQASRWIAVGDDFQVSAEALTSSIGKIGKTLDDAKWEKYGIATRSAGGSARSTNEILLDSFDTLGKITNETERAKAGNDLFGKGYAQLAPLIGKTRGEYEKMLDKVSGGQVITRKEAEKAERLRLAEDQLSDALKDVTLMVGEFVAELAPMIEVVAKAVEWTGVFQEKAEGLARSMAGLGGGVGAVGPMLQTVAEKSRGLGLDLADLDKQAGMLEGSTRGLNKEQRDNAEAAGEAAIATKRFKDSLSDLHDEVSDEQSFLDLQDTYDAYIAKQKDAEASDRDKRRASLDVKEALIQQLEAIDNIPTEKRSQIQVLIDQEKYDQAIMAIGAIPTDKTLTVNTVYTGGRRSGEYASGTNSAAPGMALVGEHGPELVAMGGGERVFNAADTKRMMSGDPGTGNNYTIVLQSLMNPDRAAVEALMDEIRVIERGKT